MIFDKSSRLGFPSQLLVPWEASLMCLLKLTLCFLMMRIALIDSVGIILVFKLMRNISGHTTINILIFECPLVSYFILQPVVSWAEPES